MVNATCWLSYEVLTFLRIWFNMCILENFEFDNGAAYSLGSTWIHIYKVEWDQIQQQKWSILDLRELPISIKKSQKSPILFNGSWFYLPWKSQKIPNLTWRFINIFLHVKGSQSWYTTGLIFDILRIYIWNLKFYFDNISFPSWLTECT